MSKIIRAMQNYLVYALPFVVMCMIWSSILPEREFLPAASTLIRFSWEILSWNLMLWFTVLISFFVVLVVNTEARERTLNRLANLQERDEREHYITGQASRAAYISSLSLLVLLLFLSIFTVKIQRVSEEEALAGKTKSLSIGLQFNMMDAARSEIPTTGQPLFEAKDLPLSKTGIILMLMIWQLGAFNLAARRQSQ